MGGFGDRGHDEEFFVEGDILLDGVDADGETAIGAGERPSVGDFEAAGVAVVGVVNLERIAAELKSRCSGLSERR